MLKAFFFLLLGTCSCVSFCPDSAENTVLMEEDSTNYRMQELTARQELLQHYQVLISHLSEIIMEDDQKCRLEQDKEKARDLQETLKSNRKLLAILKKSYKIIKACATPYPAKN